MSKNKQQSQKVIFINQRVIIIPMQSIPLYFLLRINRKSKMMKIHLEKIILFNFLLFTLQILVTRNCYNFFFFFTVY